MPDQFIHGVEVVEVTDGVRPISTVRASVIGLVGTAPAADAAKFPVNTPVLIAGRRTEAAGLGATGTLPGAVDDIFDQIGALIVVIRVEEGADEAATLANIIGGVDDDSGQYEGVHALLAAEPTLGFAPRLLIAPGFTDTLAVTTEMVAIAERLRGIIIAEGPNTNDAAATAYRGNFGTARVFLVDPAVKVFDTVAEAEVIRPNSARIAGVFAKSDAERGFWWSPSNREISGITGTARSVDFALGDPNSRANLLNENEVATIIRKDGYRLWGNRTCSADPKWAFVNRRRTADMIHESLLQAHMWAVDRNITKTYMEDVMEGVNAYLSHLRSIQAIINGRCWIDPDFNTADQLAQGKPTWSFDFAVGSPAEHLTFRSYLNNEYLVEVLPTAA